MSNSTESARAELAELEREHDASVTPWPDFSAFCEQQAMADRMHELRAVIAKAPRSTRTAASL